MWFSYRRTWFWLNLFSWNLLLDTTDTLWKISDLLWIPQLHRDTWKSLYCLLFINDSCFVIPSVLLLQFHFNGRRQGNQLGVWFLETFWATSYGLKYFLILLILEAIMLIKYLVCTIYHLLIFFHFCLYREYFSESSQMTILILLSLFPFLLSDIFFLFCW